MGAYLPTARGPVATESPVSRNCRKAFGAGAGSGRREGLAGASRMLHGDVDHTWEFKICA